MIWRWFKSLFVKTAVQLATDEAEKAYRAKRAAQRKAQRKAERDRKMMSATVGDMSATVADIPLKEKNIKIEGGPIADDWEPDKRGRDLAEKQFGERVDAEITNFRDYWLAQSGPRATRTDWQAQFRWWVRRQSTQPQLQLVNAIEGGKHGRRKSKSLAESGAELAAEFRELERRAAADGSPCDGAPGPPIRQAGGEPRGGPSN
jgi:hypothetical protein